MDREGRGHVLAHALEQQGRLEVCSGDLAWLGSIFSRQIVICSSVKIQYFSVSVSAVKSLVMHNFWISFFFPSEKESFFPSQMVEGRLTC